MQKLILAILSADAVESVSKALIERKIQATHISSSGGFLRRGNTTLVIGVSDTRIEETLVLLREMCAPYSREEHHAATIFVLSASQFIQT